MKLLIDIGNSRLKWAVETNTVLGGITSLDYRQPDFLQVLAQTWRELSLPTQITIASVADKALLTAVTALCNDLWPSAAVFMPQSSACAFGVTSAYASPEKLGIDRWLALLAAHRHYAGSKCVVDCGTAITLDALAADGKHLGGLICPGLVMMKKSLAADTASLSLNTLKYRTDLANETNAAIANGVYLAALGLIDRVMQSFTGDYCLLLTGGDADIVAEAISMPFILDKELVLKGLAIYGAGALAL